MKLARLFRTWPCGRSVREVNGESTKILTVEGGVPLEGHVRVNGSKNAALPILCATLLAEGTSTIRNVPELRDVVYMRQILADLGVENHRTSDGSLTFETRDPEPFSVSHELAWKMRASVCALGPLLAKRKRACVPYPGGCYFGVRPINLHLKGLQALGADIRIRDGHVEVTADRLKGARVYLGGPYGSTVLGTANVLMAASVASGTTVIEHAACEPEIIDLADFLNAMGARVSGAGSPRMIIEGVSELQATNYTVIPDRIEAGTLMIAAAMTNGNVVVEDACVDHLFAVIDTLQDMGVDITANESTIRVKGNSSPKSVDITTLAYPGFPTDLQAQMMAYLAFGNGFSVVTERVYPDRFGHIAEFDRMGANIRREGPTAIITGVPRLSGAPVKASDLRASASLILAGLVAEGKTEIRDIEHLDRGYERIEERLCRLGARICRVDVGKRESRYEDYRPSSRIVAYT